MIMSEKKTKIRKFCLSLCESVYFYYLIIFASPLKVHISAANVLRL